MELTGKIRGLVDAGLLPHTGDFMPAVHYPPITMIPPVGSRDALSGYTPPPDGLFDVYVHIPFCRKACTFCHYPVRTGQRHAEKDTYLDTLDREMGLMASALGVKRIRARSVLVGGGTPTWLTPEQLERFLERFSARVDLSGCTQFNLDLDPGTMLGQVGRIRLELLQQYGVDRLTIGLQALDDRVLAAMNRTHDRADALAAVERSLGMGFVTNVEFIFGYPGQTREGWARDVDQAVRLSVHEIQLYRLKYVAYGDRQGPIIRRRQAATNAPDLLETMRMKALAHERLKDAGYLETLNRVFSRDPAIFSHYADNQCCRLLDQLGFGLTAFSSLRDRFLLNTQSFTDYHRMVAEGRLPVNRVALRSREEQARWALILPLKNRELRKRAFERAAGICVDAVFPETRARLAAHGLLEEDEKVVRLTQLGRFVADEVVQSFYGAAYIPFPRQAYVEGPLNPYRCESVFDAPGENRQIQSGEKEKSSES